MKGFPNQVADLEKISDGIKTLAMLVDAKAEAKDDGVFGQALVHAGVAGTGHVHQPIETYLREQLRKAPSGQSFRTTARGLRELYRLMGLIYDRGSMVSITEVGRQAVRFADSSVEGEHLEFWRRVIRNIAHQGNDVGRSHPYQVLLRLVSRVPGITRAKCALALEATDDSQQELDRLVGLAALTEDEILSRIVITKSNWDNAKKVLPRFAEQLGDVIKTGQSYVLAESPGRSHDTSDADSQPVKRRQGRSKPHAPRSSRVVTPETIGRAGTAENFDEMEILPALDLAAAKKAIEQRRERLRRHNLIVQKLARRFAQAEADMYEDPFDILAILGDVAILVEVKSLDGSTADERDRVQESLAQLLYYEAFLTRPLSEETRVRKIACFERPITLAHQAWLTNAGIGAIWQTGDGDIFAGDGLALDSLGDFLRELRQG